MVLKPAVKYQRIAKTKGVPRDNIEWLPCRLTRICGGFCHKWGPVRV